jgi:hypothetical protein
VKPPLGSIPPTFFEFVTSAKIIAINIPNLLILYYKYGEYLQYIYYILSIVVTIH